VSATATPASDAAAHAPPGAWAPLRVASFRGLWAAFLSAQVLVWMQSVGAVEVLNDLHASSGQLALVQTATSLPTVVLALVAGALADIVDRRRLLLVTQAWMFLMTALLCALAASGTLTSGLVLLLTFGLGAGVALNTPTYQSLTPELVPRRLLAGAVSLNSVSVNLGRAVGPALGGLVVAVWSSSVLFGVEAAIVLVTAAFVARLPARPHTGTLPPEHLRAAVVAGVRYVRFAPPLRAVLARALVFVVPASALWALLPVVAYRQLGLGSAGFGVLLGCVGAGAVAGATFLPRLRAGLGLDRLVALGSIGTAAVLALMGLLESAWLIGALLFLWGGAWIAVLSSLNTSAQLVAPAWVRARVLGTYQLVFQGGLAAGSAIWGAAVVLSGARTALLIAAGLLALTPLAALRWRLSRLGDLDLREANAWSEPHLSVDPDAISGPVMVRLTYDVPAANVEPFMSAMNELGRIRRRDGATWWGVFAEVEQPGRYTEYFSVASWQEHVRQAERPTRDDIPLLERIAALTAEGRRPAAVHGIARSAN
jgi:MFS family permease